jgi:hypothetical protein
MLLNGRGGGGIWVCSRDGGGWVDVGFMLPLAQCRLLPLLLLVENIDGIL